MDAKLGGKLHQFYGPVVSETMGKKSMEWDLNEWRWDGDLFMAAPLNCAPSDCRSKQFFPVGSDVPVNNGAHISVSSGSDKAPFENERGRDLEKRRRIVEVEDEQVNEEAGSLNLKLGGPVYSITEGELDKLEEKSGKKTKLAGAPSNHHACQVENCKADLSTAKDYHRRHKVCGVHSKATSALVGDVMQRFCQQCSRFHVLQEFDEGKRSCRRRLAGHNKRRRKTHPDTEVSAATLNDEQGSNYLLISLLRILSNMQSNSSDQTKDQDLLSHLLKNLANVAGTADGRSPAGLLPVSHDLPNAGTSSPTDDSNRAGGSGATISACDLSQKGAPKDNLLVGVRHNESASQPAIQFRAEASNSTKENISIDKVGRTNLNNFDLNNVYDGSEDGEDVRGTIMREDNGNFSPANPLSLRKVSQQSCPPQISGNSGSTSSQSPSTSSREAQSRTDRIVFKLFGKDPSDFPLVLRKQILDWLSNSPTDIESYIRPGCIILTIYLRMDESSWNELHCNLSSSLGRLLDLSTDSFWRSGWIYTRVLNRVTFVYNGQVVLDTPLPLNPPKCCRISCIKPIAVTVSDSVKFVIKGFNLSRPTSRLLCALEGKYLVQENCADMTGGSDALVEHDEIQSLSFSSILPNIVGRGFIEVEDHGLNSSFFPFIVAEKDVCSEICTLESIIEADQVDNGDTKGLEFRNQALDFINEMGWLLHKTHLKFRLGETTDAVDLFPFQRFRWLIEFSTDHDWCAVVKKLLSILFDGIVDLGQHNSVLLAVLDIGLLHRAVRRNCRPMVEFLLKYCSGESLDKTVSEEKYPDKGYYLFRPDAVGPGGLTPIHIAASLDNCDNVIDALTEDPGQMGIEAWKNARDSTGLTPHDYACFRGHYSYINLVQRKLDKKSGNGHTVLDIPDAVSNSSIKPKMGNARITVFDTEVMNMATYSGRCGQCEQKLGHGSYRASLTIYRPAMLSMVAIAAVCVCAALLFKSSPEVLCSLRPFRWELLDYGSQ